MLMVADQAWIFFRDGWEWRRACWACAADYADVGTMGVVVLVSENIVVFSMFLWGFFTQFYNRFGGVFNVPCYPVS
jgi:hypothetical protein